MTAPRKTKELDIFNLTKTKDLPAGIVDNLIRNGGSSDIRNLIKLFEMKNILTVNEIIVGMYRLAGLQKSRTWVTTSIYRLIQEKVLRRVRVGEYEKV